MVFEGWLTGSRSYRNHLKWTMGCTAELGGPSWRGLGSHQEINVAIQDMQ